MQKSLFIKYLSITMGILLASYAALGGFMMMFFSDYWMDEKKNILTKNAVAVSSLAVGYSTVNQDEESMSINIPDFSMLISALANNIDADIFVSDLDGNIILGAYPCSDMTGEEIPKNISGDRVKLVSHGNYQATDTLDGIYQNNYYTVGIPLMLIQGDQTVIAGAVFATTNLAGATEYLISAFEMFLLAALVTLVLAFIIVWLFTYRMVRPLRRMSSATKAFAAGDFSVKVPVESIDEIGQLSVAFNNMATSLSNSEGMRRSFIANVSHELKTPMTTIGGFIDGILDGTIPKEKEKQYLGIVSDEIKRLSRLVKSMLDLSKIDSGELKLNPVKFNITETVFKSLLTFEQKIEDKNIEIKGLEEVQSLMAYGDKDLLHQVIYNLIENAVKFTNNEGYIYFSFTDSVDRTCVAIENSGHGISPDDLPMIFDKFYKTDKSRSEDKNGMGLGLYLVKTIISLHSGDISVQSSEEGFNRFEVFLPKPPKENTIRDGESKNKIAASSEVEVQDVE